MREEAQDGIYTIPRFGTDRGKGQAKVCCDELKKLAMWWQNDRHIPAFSLFLLVICFRWGKYIPCRLRVCR